MPGGVKMHIQNSLTARLTSTFAVSLAVVAISGCGASREEKEARFKEFWDKQHVEITAEIMKVIPEDEEGGEVSYKLFEGQDGLNLAILAYEVPLNTAAYGTITPSHSAQYEFENGKWTLTLLRYSDGNTFFPWEPNDKLKALLQSAEEY